MANVLDLFLLKQYTHLNIHPCSSHHPDEGTKAVTLRRLDESRRHGRKRGDAVDGSDG